MNKYLLLTCAMLMSVPAYATTDDLIENVKNKNLTAVETLLKGGENVNGTNAQGNTALHYAVATGNTGMVKLLLAHNADMNAANSKGWTPLKIAEKKNVGEVYNVLEEKIASDKFAAEEAAKAKAEEAAKAAEKLKAEAEAKAKAEAQKALELKEKKEAEAKAAAEKLAQQKAEAEAKAKKEAEEKAQKIKEAQARVEAEKAALMQKNEAKKAEVKTTVKNSTAKAQIPLKKTGTKAPAKAVKTSVKKAIKAPQKKQSPLKKSALSDKIYQGNEEVVYCLQYLGLQGEQKNMTVAAGYYAAENDVSKARHDVAVAEAQHYYENASAADIKARADKCGKYITPQNAVAQNKIIRSINRSIGF